MSEAATVPRIEMELPECFEKVFHTKARLIVLYGGRGSAKSQSVARFLLCRVNAEGADVLCGREFQISIDESVHKLLVKLIASTKIPNVSTTDKKIDFSNGGKFRFKGFARNSSAVRSAEGFKYSWIEEAQYLSQQSIDDLLPTIRENDSQLIFTANLMSSADPFSQRFIMPFQKQLDEHGMFEDEHHLIIRMNWKDNPWWSKELEMDRVWDYDHRSRAEYDHIWEGHYNDMVEGSIILAEWFDAAIDAHKKLGFEPTGLKVLSHDPSDLGADSKGLVLRHGSVILDVKEMRGGDVNEGCAWATGEAIKNNVDLFTWDAIGVGLGLRQQIGQAFDGKKTEVKTFIGSESPDNPHEIYQPDAKLERTQSRTNQDTFLNKRAQFYWRLRDRFFKTYCAVVKKEWVNPDELISISEDIECLAQFRSEICRIPRKPNASGKIQIMSKDEMKTKLKILSPNLADSAMMSMEIPEPFEADTFSYSVPDRANTGWNGQ